MRFLNRFLSRMRFLLHSTNHHGVHSPFVFKYLTHCLYKKGFGNLTKFQQIALKSIPYFDYRSIYAPGETDFRRMLKEAYSHLVFDRPPYDLIALEKEQIEGADLNRLAPLCHNKSAILLERFRSTPAGMVA